MSDPVLLITTRNPGKIREFRQLLRDLPIELRDLSAFPDAPHVEEQGDTYVVNARGKAVALARFTALATLADDSGLEVDALGGAPGVLSARFVGSGATDRDNVTLLLERLHNVPDAERGARFRCVIVVARPDGRELIGEGTCEGTITREPRGRSGFGYDPLFFYPPRDATFAEMSSEEKDQVSHRAQACRNIEPALFDFLTED